MVGLSDFSYFGFPVFVDFAAGAVGGMVGAALDFFAMLLQIKLNQYVRRPMWIVRNA